MSMVSSRNVQEVILFLKKELVKTHDQDYDKVDIHSTLSMCDIFYINTNDRIPSIVNFWSNRSTLARCDFQRLHPMSSTY